MACVYHAEVNAMQVACQNSRAYLNGFGGGGAAVIAGLVGGGAAAFLGTLNGLDAMRQALIVYINSGWGEPGQAGSDRPSPWAEFLSGAYQQSNRPYPRLP